MRGPLCIAFAVAAFVAAATAQSSCPPAPEVTRTALASACSGTSAASRAIGCSMFALCNNAALTPPIFSALCSTWRIASSLCSDDTDVVAAASGLCSGIRAAYVDDAQYRSCLQPYTGIRSTSGIRAGHLRACDDMAGEPMGGCDTCGTASSCPNPLVSYADGCIDMDMGQCAAWRSFCTGDAAPTGAAAAMLCRRPNNRGGIVAPPLPPSPPPPALSPSPSPSPSTSPPA